jgi:hypothetical protein
MVKVNSKSSIVQIDNPSVTTHQSIGRPQPRERTTRHDRQTDGWMDGLDGRATTTGVQTFRDSATVAAVRDVTPDGHAQRARLRRPSLRGVYDTLRRLNKQTIRGRLEIATAQATLPAVLRRRGVSVSNNG